MFWITSGGLKYRKSNGNRVGDIFSGFSLNAGFLVEDDEGCHGVPRCVFVLPDIHHTIEAFDALQVVFAKKERLMSIYFRATDKDQSLSQRFL